MGALEVNKNDHFCMRVATKRWAANLIMAMRDDMEGVINDQRVCSDIPVWRTRSATGNPNSACFKTATICSTENRFLFMANLPFHLREIRQKANINHGPLSERRLTPKIQSLRRLFNRCGFDGFRVGGYSHYSQNFTSWNGSVRSGNLLV